VTFLIPAYSYSFGFFFYFFFKNLRRVTLHYLILIFFPFREFCWCDILLLASKNVKARMHGIHHFDCIEFMLPFPLNFKYDCGI
jgi:hypothetical protein